MVAFGLYPFSADPYGDSEPTRRRFDAFLHSGIGVAESNVNGTPDNTKQNQPIGSSG